MYQKRTKWPPPKIFLLIEFLGRIQTRYLVEPGGPSSSAPGFHGINHLNTIRSSKSTKRSYTSYHVTKCAKFTASSIPGILSLATSFPVCSSLVRQIPHSTQILRTAGSHAWKKGILRNESRASCLFGSWFYNKEGLKIKIYKIFKSTFLEDQVSRRLKAPWI